MAAAMALTYTPLCPHSGAAAFKNTTSRSRHTSRSKRAVLRRVTGAVAAQAGDDDEPPEHLPFEDFRTLMAFDGVAPERTNGRLAMIGFVAAVFTEIGSHESVYQQVAAHPVAITSYTAMITLAGFIPAYTTESSFAQLISSMSTTGLPQIWNSAEDRAFWNKYNMLSADVELLHGRMAMIAFSIMLLIEGVKGSSLF